MKYTHRTQVALVAATALLVGVVSTGWWLATPATIRRTGEALMLLVGAICCIHECRRMRIRSPLALGTTIIGFIVVVFGRRVWPSFPLALAALVVLAWIGVAAARTVGRFRQAAARQRGNVAVRVAMEER